MAVDGPQEDEPRQAEDGEVRRRGPAGARGPGDPGRDDDPFDWITSPLRRVRFGRLMVLVGPLGLAIALVLSLWVSTMHVRHSLIVQVETQWQPQERLGVRAQIVAAREGPIADTRMGMRVEQGGAAIELPALSIISDGNAGEGSFEVPASLQPGAAVLWLDVTGEGMDAMHEAIPIEVVARRSAVAATPIVSGSTLQYGDDSDAQPEALRVVVRPSGRLLAGFDNDLFVRVTEPDGRPYVGAVAVWLAGGEFMGKVGEVDRPTPLFEGTTDALGLVRLRGPLDNDVLRIEVRVPDLAAGPQTRRMRLVSFAGGVMASSGVDAVAPGGTLEFKAWGLSSKLPIHVDVHGDDGAFMDVMTPPVLGREAPRPWRVPVDAVGVVQFEAHNQVTAPGESTAFVRVQVTAADPQARGGLSPLLELQRAHADDHRIERDYDAALERAWLDAIAGLPLTPAEVASARAFLLGTLPPSIFGPPVAVATRPRLDEELRRVQGRWRIAMRVLLLGGGGAFLAFMTIGMIRSHRRATEATLAELRNDASVDDETRAQLEAQVRGAARAGIARGLGVVAIMVGGIALTMFILENLVWVF